MLDLRYEKVVVCDATFGTNDKMVLPKKIVNTSSF